MAIDSDGYDVIIVGAGPAGASAAIHLAAAARARVLLAEQKLFPRPKLCGEFISPECLAHFARLGVLEEMTRAGGAEVDETIFYTRGGRAASVPSAWLGAGGALALGLSRAEMDARLLARARAAGVEVVEGAQAVGLLRDEEGRVRGVRLSADGKTQERLARVMIDATGRAHALVRFAEKKDRDRAPRIKRRAPLVAFKAHLAGARGASRVCEIYFYPGGYGGLSPVEDGLSNLCFIARGRDVRGCGSDPERVMREVLMRNRRAAETLGEAHAATEWLSVALEGFGRREPAPVHGLLAVGDAASFIDPFTGSGMLMALESGELVAHVVRRGLDDMRLDRLDGFDVHARDRFDTLAHDRFDALARDYRARYEERFGARLRLCGWLRRAAFAPQPLVELAAKALAASAHVRRKLARSTRASALPPLSH